MNKHERKYFIMEKFLKYKFTFTALIFMFCMNSYAQKFNESRFIDEYNWKFSLQTNISDFNFEFRNPINTDNWNILPYPSKISIERHIIDNLSIEMSGAVNKVKKGNIVHRKKAIDDLNALTLDAHLKYSFGKLLRIDFVDPYLSAGMGYMQLNKDNEGTVNAGIGLNIWLGDFGFMKSPLYTYDSISSRFGLNFEVLGKRNIIQESKYKILVLTAGVFYVF